MSFFSRIRGTNEDGAKWVFLMPASLASAKWEQQHVKLPQNSCCAKTEAIRKWGEEGHLRAEILCRRDNWKTEGGKNIHLPSFFFGRLKKKLWNHLDWHEICFSTCLDGILWLDYAARPWGQERGESVTYGIGCCRWDFCFLLTSLWSFANNSHSYITYDKQYQGRTPLPYFSSYSN